MVIPNRIKIGGHEFAVRLSNTMLTLNNVEHFDATNMALMICEDLTEDRQAEIFLHEILEAINWQFDLRLPHQTLTTISEGYFAAIRQNDLDFSDKSRQGEEERPCAQAETEEKMGAREADQPPQAFSHAAKTAV